MNVKCKTISNWINGTLARCVGVCGLHSFRPIKAVILGKKAFLALIECKHIIKLSELNEFNYVNLLISLGNLIENDLYL